ncbi:hypothetical protein [Streptomyces sp. NPDC101165]|uniref:hypothetical protein n=1 Tax=Streptomyces sp. NPDC101165 TaxID=3366119 RepID=UPI00381CABA4
MRNQRALAAACAAVAVLGPAAPVAVADGMGGGGGSNTVITIPGTGNIGNGLGNGFGNNNGNFCQGNNNGRGDNFGRGGNGRCDNFDRGNNNGRGDEHDQEKHHGDDNPRNIVVSPTVLPKDGGRLAITVDNCRGGTASSPAFPTVQLSPIGNDTARGVATVPFGTPSGTYEITVNCNGRTLSRPAAFTVGSGGKAGSGGGNVGLSGGHTAFGAVQAGFGGSVTSGATPTDMAIGGGLVASAVIGGGMSLMRRRPERMF